MISSLQRLWRWTFTVLKGDETCCRDDECVKNVKFSIIYHSNELFKKNYKNCLKVFHFFRFNAIIQTYYAKRGDIMIKKK